MVVVDQLSKASHFIPVKTTYKATNIDDIFLKKNLVAWNTEGDNFKLRP